MKQRNKHQYNSIILNRTLELLKRHCMFLWCFFLGRKNQSVVSTKYMPSCPKYINKISARKQCRLHKMIYFQANSNWCQLSFFQKNRNHKKKVQVMKRIWNSWYWYKESYIFAINLVMCAVSISWRSTSLAK